MRTTFQYCLRNGVLGVGWRTTSNRNTTDWDEYFSEASGRYDNLQICKYIHKWVGEGDLVWTRDAEGRYYLARVISGWEYWTSQDASEMDIDLANIFRVIFKSVEIDAVPGKVVACFRAQRTIQEIADKNAIEYSKHLWNTLSGEQLYQVNKSEMSDVFMMLDDEETEDLLFLYLQSHGWYVLPNSRKGDTMSFEYLAINPNTGEKALAQVKTGREVINRDDYLMHSHKIFLFQPNDLYTGKGAKNIICVSRNDLFTFLNDSLTWLPETFQRKVEMVGM